MSRPIRKLWHINDVLTNVTSATMSDPTSQYGIKRNDLSASTITAATKADPVVLTAIGHGLSSGQMIRVSEVLGMTELNGNDYYVAAINANTLRLYSDSDLATTVNGSGYTEYTSAGTITPTEVATGTAMTNSATGTYEYSFDDTAGIAYTAYVKIVHDASTYYFEVDIPAREASMVASYPRLLSRVGHHIFGIRTGYSSDQTTDIEECISDGLNDVYKAHPWSFFRPVKEITTTAPYSTGTITIASGVVTLSGGTFPSWAAVGVLKIDDEYYDVDTYDSDTQITLEDTSVTEADASSYELGRPEYDLPTAFEAIEGDLTYEPGQSDFYPPVKQKHDGEIRRLCQDDPYHDRPLYYGIRTVEFDPTVGSRRRLALYPTPDAAYVLKARMKLRSTMIDSSDKYPVGAESLSQVIIEACLAAAERNYDDQPGWHTDRFHELLPLAIAADQLMTSPTQLGPDAPRDETSDTVSRSARMGDVTLDGVTL